MIRRFTRAANSARSDNGGVRLSSALVPVTGAPLDADMVRLACELLESRRSTLYILYVIEVPRDTPVDAVVAEDSMAGEQALEAMEAVARRYNGVIEAQIVQARQAGSAVVREAVDKEVQAIVVGTSVADAYGSYALDQHVSYILRHAPCRVILARDPIRAAPGLPAHAPGSGG